MSLEFPTLRVSQTISARLAEEHSEQHGARAEEVQHYFRGTSTSSDSMIEGIWHISCDSFESAQSP